jgi:hypothetical protein
VTVDDPRFKKISNAQWVWYAAQVTADERERFELLRDVAEHNAMFWNPQGVEQVRGSREKTYSVSNEDFASMLEQTFGRRADLPDKPREGVMHSIPLGAKGEEADESAEVRTGRPGMLPGTDPSRYLDEDLLDDISFTPFAEGLTNG